MNILKFTDTSNREDSMILLSVSVCFACDGRCNCWWVGGREWQWRLRSTN